MASSSMGDIPKTGPKGKKIEYCPMAFQWLDPDHFSPENQSAPTTYKGSTPANFLTREGSISVPETEISMFQKSEFLASPEIKSSIHYSNILFWSNLPKLCAELNAANAIPVTSLGIKGLFHKFGLNMRHLGHVIASTRIPCIRRMLLQEMVSRSCKKLFWSLFFRKHIFTLENVNRLKALADAGTSGYHKSMNYSSDGSSYSEAEPKSPAHIDISEIPSQESPSQKRGISMHSIKDDGIKDDGSDDGKEKSKDANGRAQRTGFTALTFFLEDFAGLVFGDRENSTISKDFWEKNIANQVLEDFSYQISAKDIADIEKRSFLINFCQNIKCGTGMEFEESEKSASGVAVT